MRSVAFAAALALAATLLHVPSASAALTRDATADGVHVIGDSITFYAHRRTDLADPPPRWTSDGFPGRRITALRTTMTAPSTDYTVGTQHMFRIERDSKVSTVVLALGTNGADAELTLEQATALYRRAVARMRALPIWKAGPRKVVLVTPYVAPWIRQGVVNPLTGAPYPRKHWASKSAVYARAMARVDEADVGVCVMPWRATVLRTPGLISADGIHPNDQGYRTWAALLATTVRDCARRQAVLQVGGIDLPRF